MHGEMYKRKDKKYAWRVVADNGKIVAVDGAQGYSRPIDCRKMYNELFPEISLTELR